MGKKLSIFSGYLTWRDGELNRAFSAEAERIRTEYQRRAQEIPPDFYALGQQVNLFRYQQYSRALLQMLNSAGLMPLNNKKILDVGCGSGQLLVDLESWGARRENLAGIDLIESRVFCARIRLGPSHETAGLGADIRIGNASILPWSRASFDIVNQSIAFTSIIDDDMKKAVAAEMLRLLKPGGVVIWYDFLFDNPRNASVRGIRAREIRSLFPECTVKLKRITLAPPVARRLVPLSWILALVLEKMAFFNTHYLGIICKRNSSG